MVLSLGKNIAAISTQRFLERASSDLSTSFERLSSGMRINNASDDAAGLAIADSLRVDARVRNVALRNVNDGISMLSIVDSTLENQSQILGRLSELAESSANGTYSDVQRVALSKEYRQLVAEFGRLGDSAVFNGIKPLLAGRGGSSSSVRFQAGVNGAATSGISVTMSDFGTFSGVLDFDQMLNVFSDPHPQANGFSASELASLYGSVMSASVTVGGKSYDLLIGLHQGDIIIGTPPLQQVHAEVYCRNSDTLLGAGSPQTNWVQLAGSLDLNFNQSTGKFVSSTSNTFSNLTAGNFDLSGLDFTGLELRSTNRTNGLQQFTSQSAATSVLELSGIEDLGRARTALDQIGVKRDQISSYRGTIGAMQSRLSTAAALLLSSKEQSLAAESRIRDVDVAQESANYVAAQIRQQASAAVMSSVKMQQKLILQLL